MMNPTQTSSQTQGDPAAPMWDIRDIFAVLRRRWLWVLAPALLLCLAALTLKLALPPRYDAKATLLIDPRGLQIVERNLEPNRQTGEESLAVVESQLRVLTSDGMLRRIVDDLKLVDDIEFGKPPPGVMDAIRGVVASLVGGGGATADPRSATLERLQKAVRAERAAGSYIVDLYVRSEDPDKAARLANAIADRFIAEDRGSRSRVSDRASGELDRQLEGLKARVRVAEENIEAFKTKNRILTARGDLVNEQQLAELTNQLVTARVLASQAQSRVDQITEALRNGGDADSIGESIQSTTIGALRVRIAAARQTEASLLASLLPSHPSVKSVQASIRSINAQLREELRRIAATARADLARAKTTETQLTAQQEKLRNDAERTNSAAVGLRDLERERDASRKIYEAFLLRARELDGQSSVDTSNSRILSRAVAPFRKSGPGLAVLLAGGLAAGLAIGALMALLAEQLAPKHPVRAHAMPNAPQVPLRRGPAGYRAPSQASNRQPSLYDTEAPTMFDPDDSTPRPSRSRPRVVATLDDTPDPAPSPPTFQPQPSPRPHRAAQPAAYVTPTPVEHAGRAATATSAVRITRPHARRMAVIGEISSRGVPDGHIGDVVCAAPASHDADVFFSAAHDIVALRGERATRTVLCVGRDGDRDTGHVAFNLALALVAAGETVLLIDADLDSQRLTRSLVPDAQRGLADIARAQLRVEDVIWRDPDTFDLIPTGTTRLDEVPRLRLVNAVRGIARGSHDYSVVIVDGGALRGRMLARDVASAVDDIVVARSARGTYGALDLDMPEDLAAFERKIRGTIVVAR